MTILLELLIIDAILAAIGCVLAIWALWWAP